MAEEKEIVFYSDDKGVRVTSARAIIGSTTYAMANVTSVSLGKIPPKRGGAIWLIVLGIATVVTGLIAQAWAIDLLGLALFSLGVWLAIIAKPKYTVQIGSASGSVQAVTNKDQKYIQSIVNAMNEAFIKRG